MYGTSSASFRSLVLPKEHGSWSFAFEPVALGLLVAPSRPGFVLAAAIVAGFFVRRPLKLAVTLPKSEPRRSAAAKWTIFWSALALVGIFAAAQLATWSALWPLLLCAPFGAIFLWFDLRNVMREAEAELSGSTAFALIPAAMATLAGWSAPAALALAALMLARSFPTVLTVRTYLRHAKGKPAPLAPTLIAAVTAAFTILALGWFRLVPAFAGLLVAGLFLRTAFLVSLFRPTWSAKRIGMTEAAIGVLYLAGIALAYRFN